MSLKIKKVKINKLTPDSTNPRKHNDKNIRAIRTSLETFGQVLPIVVKEGVVVGGNGTLQAMQELGWEECDTVELSSDMTEAEVRSLKVALNRTSELAGWDYEVLTPIFEEMKEAGHDLAAFGWDDYEIDPLLKSDWSAPTPIADAPTATTASTTSYASEPLPGAPESNTTRALGVAREHLGKKASDREALEHICTEWLAAQE